MATIEDVDDCGCVAARGIETISADGLTTILEEDTANSGFIDHTDEAVMRADGSEVETISDINADGSLASSTTTIVSADGQTSTSQTTFRSSNTDNVWGDSENENFYGTTDVIAVSGCSDTIVVGDGVNKVDLSGNGNRVHETGNSSVTISADGSGESLEASARNNVAGISGASVFLDDGASLILSGSNDAVTMYDNTRLQLWSGSGDDVEISGNGAEVVASSANVSVDDGYSVLVSGNDNCVTAFDNAEVVDADRSTNGDSLEVNGEALPQPLPAGMCRSTIMRRSPWRGTTTQSRCIMTPGLLTRVEQGLAGSRWHRSTGKTFRCRCRARRRCDPVTDQRR